MSSLQAQLLSAKRNLSTTEESSSRDKSVLESKLVQTQKQLEKVKGENELKKVCSVLMALSTVHYYFFCVE